MNSVWEKVYNACCFFFVSKLLMIFFYRDADIVGWHGAGCKSEIPGCITESHVFSWRTDSKALTDMSVNMQWILSVIPSFLSFIDQLRLDLMSCKLTLCLVRPILVKVSTDWTIFLFLHHINFVIQFFVAWSSHLVIHPSIWWNQKSVLWVWWIMLI